MSSEEERTPENTPTQDRNDIPFEKGYQPERSNLRSPVIHLREDPAFLQNHRLAQAKLRKTIRDSNLYKDRMGLAISGSMLGLPIQRSHE